MSSHGSMPPHECEVLAAQTHYCSPDTVFSAAGLSPDKVAGGHCSPDI